MAVIESFVDSDRHEKVFELRENDGLRLGGMIVSESVAKEFVDDDALDELIDHSTVVQTRETASLQS